MSDNSAANNGTGTGVSFAPEFNESSVETELEADSLEEGSEEESEEGSTEQMSEAEKKAEIKRLKKLKLKFNGQELEEELPFEVDDNPEVVDYLTRKLQLARLGQVNGQKYSQLEKEVVKFFEDLKKNPRKALSDPRIGIDLKQLAAEMLEEEIVNSQKSPEQIEKERLEARLKELEEEREKEKEEMRQKELERLMEQEYERYDAMISRALETSDLPKSPYVVKKMADYMILGIQNGIDVQPEQVLGIVREEIVEDIKQMFSAMPVEVINQIIGKDNYDKIRKYNLSKAKPKKSPAVEKKAIDTGKASDKKVEEQVSKKTIKEIFGV